MIERNRNGRCRVNPLDSLTDDYVPFTTGPYAVRLGPAWSYHSLRAGLLAAHRVVRRHGLRLRATGLDPGMVPVFDFETACDALMFYLAGMGQERVLDTLL